MVQHEFLPSQRTRVDLAYIPSDGPRAGGEGRLLGLCCQEG
jgi:hypothetical protein